MPISIARRFFALALIAAAGHSFAGHHLMKVVEVFPGTVLSPNAQYIVLQLYGDGQIFVNGQAFTVYNAAGTEVGSFTFTANLTNGANQAKVFIATTQAQTLFGITANLTITPVLSAAGGKVCHTTSQYDCFAWGGYTGSPTGVGAPFRATTGRPGLVPGRAAVRRLDIVGSPTALDFGDDTNDCANDFRVGIPAPRNNAGQAGTIPASTCGNNAIESIEQCDDGDTESGDGCSSSCLVEFCGDGLTQGPEQCDDSNIANGDGCSSMCLIEAPLIFLNGFE